MAQPQRGPARPLSQRSFRSINATPRSRRPSLERVQSGQHFDDHYGYYHHDHENDVADTGFAGDADSASTDRTRTDAREAGPDLEKGRVEDDEQREETESYEEQEPEVVPEAEVGNLDQRDVDTRPTLEKTRSLRSEKFKDPNLVSWDGPEDPANPKNWSIRRKWAATFVVSSFTFISPVSSSMVAPALSTMGRELGITSTVEESMILSIFVLAYAIGPLFLGPMSEVYGRIPILQLSNLFYLVWNLACGFAQTPGQMLAFRFLSGLGGSAPLAVGGGLISDTWSADQRGKAIGIYSLAPLIGPAIGPIAGGFITERTTWRWVFWATTCVDAAIQISGFFFLQETYAPVLLKKKADRLRKETGNADLHTEWETADRQLGKILRTAFSRPFILLGTQPIIQFLSLYLAYLYGTMYLILSTFPGLWTSVYHESIGIGGLNYISLGVGFFLGSQITGPLNDTIYRRLKAKNAGVGRPEFRVPTMFVGSVLIPIGLFWYGWSAQAGTHWIVPNLGALIFSAGAINLFQSMTTYIVDAYTRYAASGIAAAVVLRSLAAFGFPLFAPAMYDALGYGWGNSVLGFVAIVIGIPAPYILWFYGEKLRGKSQYASGS